MMLRSIIITLASRIPQVEALAIEIMGALRYRCR